MIPVTIQLENEDGTLRVEPVMYAEMVARREAWLREHRDAARADQQSENDQHGTPQVLALEELHDPDNNQDHGDQPQQEVHGEESTP